MADREGRNEKMVTFWYLLERRVPAADGDPPEKSAAVSY